MLSNPMNGRARLRHQLLAGSSAALALTLAAGVAYAQRLDTNAARMSTNDQAVPGGTITAGVAGGSLTTTAGPIADTKLQISDNTLRANAAANRADQTLVGDDQAVGGSHPLAILSSDALSVSGGADTLIANRQTGGYVDVEALAFDTPITLGVGAATQSGIAVENNFQQATARGNVMTANAAATADAGSAGLVNLQTMAPQSATVARAWRGVSIVTDALAASDVSASSNTLSAIAEGNDTDNRLTLSGSELSANGMRAPPPAVRLGANGSGTVFGNTAMLSSQWQGGIVKARAGKFSDGPAFGTSIQGDASNATVASDNNLLSANAAGNRSSSQLNIDTRVIATDPEQVDTAVAEVANAQRTQSPTVNAATFGGSEIQFAGAVQDSRASASGNRSQAVATGNLATETGLSVSASEINAQDSGYRVGAQYDGSASVGSLFGVQNVQDYGTTVIGATQLGSNAAIVVDGSAEGANLVADGNAATAAASGNRAIAALDLTSASFGASAALNNVQAGDGNVIAQIGTPAIVGGVSIGANGAVLDSTLSVSGNSATGTAIGNGAANTLEVSASNIAHANSNGAEITGVAAGGYGARTPFALASYQQDGRPATANALTPTISSTIVGDYGPKIVGAVTNSRIAIDDNNRAATALGNTVLNRLLLDAAQFAADTGTSLASTQTGDANVSANVTAGTAIPGTMDGSTVSISGNRTTALAAINDADSSLTFAAQQMVGSAPTAAITWTPQFQVTASGGRALVNHQAATGSAAAVASSGSDDRITSAGMSGSRLVSADNVTAADASANRAVNAIATSTMGAASDALANSQTSDAQVTSTVVASTNYGVGAVATPAVADSSIAFARNTASALARGNAADNSLSVETLGTAGGSTAAAALNATARLLAGNASLYSSQNNSGAVAATAFGAGYMSLSGPGGALNAEVAASGNDLSASAYGNSVTNRLAINGPAGSAVLANFQQTGGAVTAQISGAGFSTAFGPAVGSRFSLSGNQLSATAVGNQASSAIATPR